MRPWVLALLDFFNDGGAWNIFSFAIIVGVIAPARAIVISYEFSHVVLLVVGWLTLGTGFTVCSLGVNAHCPAKS